MRRNSSRLQLEGLLKDTPVSFYWAGFILADGSIFKERIFKIELSNKDRDHLEKFAMFINYGDILIGQKSIAVSFTNSEILPKFIEKFDIKFCKTYNPPNLDWMQDDKLILSLIIGFIDGDGSFRYPKKHTGCNLTIKLHKTWFDTLRWMEESIYKKLGFKKDRILTRINNQGYAELVISRNIILYKLKQEGLKMGLPWLDRKWRNIKDIGDPIGKKECRLRKIKNLITNGFSIEKIAEKLGMKYSNCYRFLRANNLCKFEKGLNTTNRLIKIKKIYELKKANLTVKEIARDLDESYNSVWSFMNRNNLFKEG